MTAAEAQAFKRAGSCFGLGRYLYNLPETWVPLDGQGKPIRLPALPDGRFPRRIRRPARPTRPAVHGLR